MFPCVAWAVDASIINLLSEKYTVSDPYAYVEFSKTWFRYGVTFDRHFLSPYQHFFLISTFILFMSGTQWTWSLRKEKMMKFSKTSKIWVIFISLRCYMIKMVKIEFLVWASILSNKKLNSDKMQFKHIIWLSGYGKKMLLCKISYHNSSKSDISKKGISLRCYIYFVTVLHYLLIKIRPP